MHTFVRFKVITTLLSAKLKHTCIIRSITVSRIDIKVTSSSSLWFHTPCQHWAWLDASFSLPKVLSQTRPSYHFNLTSTTLLKYRLVIQRMFSVLPLSPTNCDWHTQKNFSIKVSKLFENFKHFQKPLKDRPLIMMANLWRFVSSGSFF